MKNIFLLMMVLLPFILPAQQWNEKKVTEYWQSGRTLPLEFYAHCKKIPLKLQNDKGYNVLVDVAHQCNFAAMWKLPPRLHRLGYRSHSGHAALNSVLEPGGRSRMRLPYDMEGKVRPFGWCPNLSYNVVITAQGNPDYQHYTVDEIRQLKKFVEEGGSLVVMAHPVAVEKMAGWSLNALLKEFGAEIGKAEKYKGRSFATFHPGNDWEVVEKGEQNPVEIRRDFGRGRVVALGHAGAWEYVEKDRQAATSQAIDRHMEETMVWLCEKQKPVGGYFPVRTGGGGDIYPELESVVDGIVVYYSANQKEDLLHTIREEFPKITRQIYSWYPSKPTREPMYLILCAGNGGGWAVNAFKPKENGVISLQSRGIISIYAHELAHTMKGPINDKGETAGLPPIGNSGEAHAGWFQGKINAIYDESLQGKPNRACDRIFRDTCFRNLDFTQYYENESGRKKFGKGKDWDKTWYIWQRLDDVYGPSWYPRWKWIQHMRWADKPEYRLSWEEMTEDMSIAVGEDLFPFMHECGICLNRKSIGKVEFQGKKLKLKPADIPVITPGKVRLEQIEDYKREL